MPRLAVMWSAHLATTDDAWAPSADTRPTNLTPTILEGVDRPRRLGLMRWGWSRDFASSGLLLHARSEDIMSKRTYADAIQRRRCLIPASAWFDVVYADQTNPRRGKTTYRIRPTMDAPWAMGGIYEVDPNMVGRTVIVMAAAHASISSLERMPVVVPLGDAATWLMGSTDAALGLARPVEAIAEAVA